MPNAQLARVQIDSYGPWTATPRLQPGADLPTPQEQFPADLAGAAGTAGTRFRIDTMTAVTDVFAREGQGHSQAFAGSRCLQSGRDAQWALESCRENGTLVGTRSSGDGTPRADR